MNISCVICAELFINPDSIFTTPCGHIFHHPCLMQWLERSKSCPQCRNKCSDKNIHRIFFNLACSENIESPVALMQKIDDLQLSIREKDSKIKSETQHLEKAKSDLNKCAKTICKLETMLDRDKEINKSLQHQIEILRIQERRFATLESDNTALMRKVNEMQVIETVLTASQKEVEEMLKLNNDSRTLSVMVAALKRELSGNELRKQEIKKQLQRAQSELRMEIERRKQMEEKISELESENFRLSSKSYKMRESQTETDTPPESRKKRLLDYTDVQNTPSPLSTKEMQERAAQINNSESPYFRVGASSLGLGVLKKPSTNPTKLRSVLTARIPKFNPTLLSNANQEDNQGSSTSIDGASSSSAKDSGQYSIFKKPRLAGTNFGKLRQSNVVYNGMGGSSKVLLSDEKAETRRLKPF